MGGEGGSQLRSFILYSIARLERQRGKFFLAQHCIGLCLKENYMPGGNLKVWELWMDIAREIGNDDLELECQDQIEKVLADEKDVAKDLSRLLLKKRSDAFMRRDPWQVK